MKRKKVARAGDEVHWRPDDWTAYASCGREWGGEDWVASIHPLDEFLEVGLLQWGSGDWSCPVCRVHAWRQKWGNA